MPARRAWSSRSITGSPARMARSVSSRTATDASCRTWRASGRPVRGARAGSAVVLDAASGEVLAMVNQPAYNPNDREQIQSGVYRNRAATDIFEPGSSIKPFFVAAGLASGKYDKRSVIDTSPGFFKVRVKIFEDEHNYG